MRKALSEAQPGQPGGPSKRKKAAARAQTDEQQTKSSEQKAAAQAKAAHDTTADRRYRGVEASSRHAQAAEAAPPAGPAGQAHGGSAAGSEPGRTDQGARKRDGGEQPPQVHKRPKLKGNAAEGGQQRRSPEGKPRAAEAAGQGQGPGPAVKAEEREADEGRAGVREGGAEGSDGVLAAVEYLGDGCTRGQQLGEVNLASFDSYMCASLPSMHRTLHSWCPGTLAIL